MCPPRLMNKLQPGSVPKINRSMQNWHQVRGWGRHEEGAPGPPLPGRWAGQGRLTVLPLPPSSQLENLSTFIKAMVSYGMNPVDLFEANDLFESGNMTQVQVSLLALAGKVRPRERRRPAWGPTLRSTWTNRCPGFPPAPGCQALGVQWRQAASPAPEPCARGGPFVRICEPRRTRHHPPET